MSVGWHWLPLAGARLSARPLPGLVSAPYLACAAAKDTGRVLAELPAPADWSVRSRNTAEAVDTSRRYIHLRACPPRLPCNARALGSSSDGPLHESPVRPRRHESSLNMLFAFTAHMNAASVSTSFTSCSRKCRAAIVASTPPTSDTSLCSGAGPGTRSSSTSRELRRRFAPPSRRPRFPAVGVGPPGPGLAVDVRRRACPCAGRWLRARSSDEGGPGSSAVNGDGSSSGMRSKQARYRCSASAGSVAKSTCRPDGFVSATCQTLHEDADAREPQGMDGHQTAAVYWADAMDMYIVPPERAPDSVLLVSRSRRSTGSFRPRYTSGRGADRAKERPPANNAFSPDPRDRALESVS